MRETWWERPMCFICDYWWAILLAVGLALAAFFSRNLWLPLIGGQPASTPISPVSTWTVAPAETPLTPSPLSTPSPTPSSPSGYTNTSGGYSFNYPDSWEGLETGADAHFLLPDGSKVQISVRNATPNDTLQTVANDSGPIVIPQPDTSDTTVGGEPALKNDYVNSDNAITSRAYYAIHNGRVYYIALFASPDAPLPPTFPNTLAEFDQMVNSLYFLQP